MPTRGAVDESGKFVTMDNATNDRKTIGMHGSGFIEMLARQMTADLQAERDSAPPGTSVHLISKGISFGILTHNLSAPPLAVDLTSDTLPLPRLHDHRGVVMVAAYTDLKVHDITTGPGDSNCEPLDQNQPAGSPGFFAGNCKFITRKLWGFYNQGGAFMHHGKFTTAREAIEAHNGEALAQRKAFDALPVEQQNDLIEFLKSLQVLPPGSRSFVIDENGNAKSWPKPGSGDR